MLKTVDVDDGVDEGGGSRACTGGSFIFSATALFTVIAD